MKKIISIVLNPFTNDSRVLKENLSLKKAGYDVEILAIYKEGLSEFEIVKGITIRRLRKFSLKYYKNKDNLLSFSSLSLKGKIKQLPIRIIKKLFNFNLFQLFFNFARESRNADIIHCNDLYTLPMGVIVKKFYNKNVKIVYDAHEHETEINGLKGRKKLFKKLLERVLIRYADKVITVSGAIADDYVKMYNIERPALVLNTPNYKRIEKKNIFREKLGIRVDQTIVLYQGALSKGRGIETLLEVFKNMKEEKSVVVFMGYGILEDLIKKVSSEYRNIYFHPAVSPDVLLDYTCSSDFGISTIEDICLSYRYCLPNKMFEYLMAEVPVIISNLPEMRKLVEKNKVGVISKENTIEGLKNAILEAEKLDKNDLHANILKVKEVYNWEEQEKVLLNLYNELS